MYEKISFFLIIVIVLATVGGSAKLIFAGKPKMIFAMLVVAGFLIYFVKSPMVCISLIDWLCESINGFFSSGDSKELEGMSL